MEQQVQKRTWFSHPQLHNKISRLTKRVTELIDQGRFPEGLTLDAHGNKRVELVTTTLVGQTFQINKNAIRECLMSDKVSKIGIYGMGGVGKTTLVTHIHDELYIRSNDSVAWVTVSQNFGIRKLQNDIATAMELQIENDDDERRRAARLAQDLRKRNNFVLILDDVWQHFPLDRVGIPTSGNGFKLIITSRSLEVCRRIGCEEYIKVEPLPEKEAWELFTEKLGHDNTLSLEIEPIAKSLIKKCSGLPLAIITMAGCMRKVEDIIEWNDALEKMNVSVVEDDDDMGIEVFQVLKYSYDMLKDPKVQQCFLYCSLFPEDFGIQRETLIEYFIDERLVDRGTRYANLNRGHTILNKLENVCLLEGYIGSKYGGRKYVKMHDLVRSMAIKIARVDSRFLVEAGEGLREIPGDEKWAEDLTKVSLMVNPISRIPSSVSPKCPRLSTLLLNNNGPLRSISDCFFRHMLELNVLDLSYTGIVNLPASISNLVNLTALLLKGCCTLIYIPSLENLKALMRLNISQAGITELPQGLEMLLNLRYLNLDGTNLRRIPVGMFPKLTCLQYLATPDIGRFTLEEVLKLKNLEFFKGQLYDIRDLNTFSNCRENIEGPNIYILLVGDHFKCEFFDYFLEEYDRTIFFKECKISSKSRVGEDSMLVLPKDVQSVQIEQCNDISSLCDISSLKNATQLVSCRIHFCQGMEHVVCFCSCSFPLIRSLKSLRLEYLWELRALIGRGTCCASASSQLPASQLLQTAIFSSLNEFVIIACGKMKRLFMPVLLLHLKHLQVLKVQECQEMVEIVGETSDEDENEDEDEENQEPASMSNILALPNLRDLQLIGLPELKRISSREMVFDSLKEIFTNGCSDFLFNGQHVTADFGTTYHVFESRIVQPEF
ncbi:hypothetical protein FEM48_Zijuj08G0189500 [Ziziphus jujuba var. spinosa]|uniref:AAA+ ATPase domain-containing protein n=1 Tax=Ziziphus jujuba var. spinosa TaxID=714518 RepID=A0A978V0T3_ZIZJJ|nr:hypothetical protein FEM48_Zijuj08G0189500 [Ziziphus jujuba var. spinosa]